MGYRNDDVLGTDSSALLHEAASSGFESVEELLRLFSSRRSNHSPPSPPPEMEIDAAAGTAVSKFRKMISLLGRNRTGHARFRRAPVPIPVQKPPVPADPSEISRIYYATPIQQIPPPPPPQISHYRHNNGASDRHALSPSPTTINFSYSSATSSFVSSLTAGGDAESNRHHAPSPSFRISRPPAAACSLKRKCSSENLGSGGKCGGSSGGRCHCSKKRKLRSRKVVRVPAISLKLADIPPDDYSWRKYGQKPIKGSPHPRGYYKCSSVRGCPARKHVERAVDDPGMLVVTYEGEHNHSMAVAEVGSHILESS